MFAKILSKATIMGLLLGSSNAQGTHPILKEPQVIPHYGFDFKDHKLPLAYDTYGAAV
jgi:hypothetical protein